MSNVILFAGTSEGRLLAEACKGAPLTLYVCVATEYGETLIEPAENVHVLAGHKDAAAMEDLIAEIGMDAVLGERGVGLSEGQAQRVAVARALLSQAPILLLDEATSALDEETEAKMLENISAMRDKTCLIVTHRRAALAICDYSLHLSEGRMTKIEGAGSI